MGLSLAQGSRNKNKIGADPRNTQWANNFEQFGHQQLLKMGWKPGRGLGSSIEGIKEHIKIKHKTDNKGLGQISQPDIPTGLDDFQRLLGKLNGTEDEVNKEIDRKARLSGGLYMNFVRGEILGQEKENDENLNEKVDKLPKSSKSSKLSKSSKKDKKDKKKDRKSVKESKKKSERALEKLKKKERKEKYKEEKRKLRESRTDGEPKPQPLPESQPLPEPPKTALRGIRATRNKYIAMKRQATMDEKGLKEILMI